MPTRAGDRVLTFLARSVRDLNSALMVSALIHVLLVFGLTPIVPVNSKLFGNTDPPLDVVLVNKRTLEKPLKADVLAQANLAGGGDVDEDRVASSPLPASAQDSPDREVQELKHRVEAVEQQAQALMQRLKSDYQTPQTRPEAVPEPPTPTSAPNNLTERSLEMARLAARTEEQWELYQKRPRREEYGARAREYTFARYVDDWRAKVERIGNLNYPEAARRDKVYGSLMLTVYVNSDGTVESMHIERSSRNRVLDTAAMRIVEMSAPFAPFPPEMSKKVDILGITRTWTFTRSDQLTSQ